MAAFTAYSSTFWFNTGRVPGRPQTTGSMWVLGSSPKVVEALVKILLLVPSCTWVSRPITASHSACAAAAICDLQLLGVARSYGSEASPLSR